MGLNILDPQTRLTSLGCYGKLINVAFLEYWAVWTVCTGRGKTVQQHITECILVSPQVVASYDLWICHAFFGMPGSSNDINVLDASNLFANLREGCGPSANYTIMGNHYNMGYYLADGIYPKWVIIVQSISHPQELAHEFFAKKHESYRKDVERAFRVLQARFAIIRGPARF